MAPAFDSPEWKAALDLVFNGCATPNGYTEAALSQSVAARTEGARRACGGGEGGLLRGRSVRSVRSEEREALVVVWSWRPLPEPRLNLCTPRIHVTNTTRVLLFAQVGHVVLVVTIVSLSAYVCVRCHRATTLGI